MRVSCCIGISGCTIIIVSPDWVTRSSPIIAVVQGQDVLNIDNFYSSLVKSPNSKKLFELIQNSGNKKLRSVHDSIEGLERELFDIIMGTIKIPNGEPSELWFAIMYNGQIKGGVAGETGITSDVDIDGQGVSLKNYSKINTIDFGSLSQLNVLE